MGRTTAAATTADTVTTTAGATGRSVRRSFPWEAGARSYSRSIRRVWHAAEGAHLIDECGERYLDMLSGAGALPLGHHHPAVEAAVAAHRHVPATYLDMRTGLEERFVRALTPILPIAGSDACVQFCGPSGSDAVEAAIKLARIATGRPGIVAFQGAYHGMSQGALAVTSKRSVRERGLWSAQPVAFCPFPYPRGFPEPFRTADAASRFCLAQLELLLTDDHSGVATPAAVIVEPIQGEGGCVVPPPGFLADVQRLCRRHGVLLIADEVQTGIGRTGAWFACTDEAVEPDILCLSKAIGGGYPMAAIAYRRGLDRFRPGEHIGTFRGQAMAMSAGLATLEHIRSAGLLARVAAQGAALLAALQALLARHPALDAEVRGRGLMLGIEIGGPAGGRIAGLIQRLLLRASIVVETGGRRGAVVRLLPPLTLSDAQCAHFLDALDRVLDRVTGRLVQGASPALEYLS
jgi:diaminobutyrate-2-oxoglutarate transaminase